MNNPQLDQAREWARDKIEGGYFHDGDRPLAAAELIQSLPDEWIDAEKVQELIDTYKHARDGNAAGTEGWVMNHLVVRNLESLLLAPPLPTLADLIERGGDPGQYVGMQCEVDGEVKTMILLARDGLGGGSWLLASKLGYSWKMPRAITPLPDLPRLEWPAQEPRNPENPPAETLNNASSGTPRKPRPEDVSAGEAWRVKVLGEEVNALKTNHPHYPWSVSSKPAFEGRNAYSNAGVTLVSRLVTEDKP